MDFPSFSAASYWQGGQLPLRMTIFFNQLIFSAGPSSMFPADRDLVLIYSRFIIMTTLYTKDYYFYYT